MSAVTPGEEGLDVGALSFEQALARLDDTVEALEAGELPLAEATSLYEKGMKLARVCSEMLAAAELKITQIQTAYGEQMRLPQGEPPKQEE
jgi:exodeoxyribonuclease VII small subunit